MFLSSVMNCYQRISSINMGYVGCTFISVIAFVFEHNNLAPRMADQDWKLVVRNALTSMGVEGFPGPSVF